MALFNANLMIKEARLAKGLTQEQLAEGICSRETIVKLEKGDRKPSRFVYREILHRLGLEQFYYQGIGAESLGSEGELAVAQASNRLGNLTAADDDDGIKAELDTIDSEIEKGSAVGKVWLSPFGYRVFLEAKANFYCYGKYENPELAVKYAVEYLKLARPDFEIDKIQDYFLATHEVSTLNALAIAYVKLDGPVRALEIMQKTKQSIEKNYHGHKNLRLEHTYKVLIGNIITGLNKAGQYEACLDLANECLDNSMFGGDVLFQQQCLNCKAKALMHLGQKAEGEELYKKVLLASYGLDGYGGINFAEGKKYYEDTFGGELDLSVEW